MKKSQLKQLIKEEIIKELNAGTKYIVASREGSGDRWMIYGSELLTKPEADKIAKEAKQSNRSVPITINIYDFQKFYNDVWRGGMFPNVYKPEKVIYLKKEYMQNTGTQL
jgi:hypothetical protein